ncbi:uncharacterized protein LOC143847832 [Tasmannia lanceolata]|uniref:uncharacterized protein LOC143847832 n=1 Tax=Tasmannia lanceolata TaxID=3420 RepID=UPI0040630FC1
MAVQDCLDGCICQWEVLSLYEIHDFWFLISWLSLSGEEPDFLGMEEVPFSFLNIASLFEIDQRNNHYEQGGIDIGDDIQRVFNMTIYTNSKSRMSIFTRSGKDFFDFIFKLLSLPKSVLGILKEQNIVEGFSDLRTEALGLPNLTPKVHKRLPNSTFLELRAIHYGISLAAARGFKYIAIESDNESAVNLILDHLNPSEDFFFCGHCQICKGSTQWKGDFSILGS